MERRDKENYYLDIAQAERVFDDAVVGVVCHEYGYCGRHEENSGQRQQQQPPGFFRAALRPAGVKRLTHRHSLKHWLGYKALYHREFCFSTKNAGFRRSGG